MSLPKISANCLKNILNLKELEERVQQRETYDFIEPERCSFTYIEVPQIVRKSSSQSKLQIIRRQTSEKTLKRRESVFLRDEMQDLILNKQKQIVDDEREAILNEINTHKALTTEELFQLVIERKKSKEPINFDIIDEVNQIPQIAFAMTKMNEKAWLHVDEGVNDHEKVSAILKGFQEIYNAKKEAFESNGDKVEIKRAVKNFEGYLYPNYHRRYKSVNRKRAPKVELLPFQEKVRQMNLKKIADRMEKEGGPRKSGMLNVKEVRNMIEKRNNYSKKTSSKDYYNSSDEEIWGF